MIWTTGGGRVDRWTDAMLLDRGEERAALNGLINAAGDGLSGALVLHGEAGMGKTALLSIQLRPRQTCRSFALRESKRSVTLVSPHCIAFSSRHSIA